MGLFDRGRTILSSMTSEKSKEEIKFQKLRDAILDDQNPTEIASKHDMALSDLARKFERLGMNELKQDEEHENKIEDAVDETKAKIDKIAKREVENPDLPEYETKLKKAEERLEIASNKQKEIIRKARDAEKFFKAGIIISKVDGSKVGQQQFNEGIEEAENFENMALKYEEKLELYEDVLKTARENIDEVMPNMHDKVNYSNKEKYINKQKEAIQDTASEIHRKLYQ